MGSELDSRSKGRGFKSCLNSRREWCQSHARIDLLYPILIILATKKENVDSQMDKPKYILKRDKRYKKWAL